MTFFIFFRAVFMSSSVKQPVIFSEKQFYESVPIEQPIGHPCRWMIILSVLSNTP